MSHQVMETFAAVVMWDAQAKRVFRGQEGEGGGAGGAAVSSRFGMSAHPQPLPPRTTTPRVGHAPLLTTAARARESSGAGGVRGKGRAGARGVDLPLDCPPDGPWMGGGGMEAPRTPSVGTDQTCHYRPAGKLVLSRNRPHTKGHSVIPTPPPPPELSRNVLHPACGSVGPCSHPITSETADASGKSGTDRYVQRAPSSRRGRAVRRADRQALTERPEDSPCVTRPWSRGRRDRFVSEAHGCGPGVGQG